MDEKTIISRFREILDIQTEFAEQTDRGAAIVVQLIRRIRTNAIYCGTFSK